MITRIHHVAMAVRDIESALGFYRDGLGLSVGRRATVADQGVHAALLPLEEGEIELLEPTDPTGGVARFLERRGEGPHHLCLETPDVSSVLEHARAVQVPLIDQTPRQGLAGLIGFLHPKACHGLLVELAQPPGHPEALALPRPGVLAVGIDTVYVAVKEAEAAATTLARNLGGSVAPSWDSARLDARQILVWVGRSRLTVLGLGEPSDFFGVARFLAERGEGLYGIALGVRDFSRALQHLAALGIPVDVAGKETLVPLAKIEAGRTHGVNLFLCPATSG